MSKIKVIDYQISNREVKQIPTDNIDFIDSVVHKNLDGRMGALDLRRENISRHKHITKSVQPTPNTRMRSTYLRKNSFTGDSLPDFGFRDDLTLDLRGENLCSNFRANLLQDSTEELKDQVVNKTGYILQAQIDPELATKS